MIIAMTCTAPARTSVGSRRPKKRLGSGKSNVMLAVHNLLGPVSTAACLHLNLSCSNFGVPVQLEWEVGHLLLRRHPGLGVEFDRDLQKVLARKRHVAARHVLGPFVVQKLVDRSLGRTRQALGHRRVV